MKVLWVNQFAALPQDGGGTRHFELGRELVRKGWQVSVLASDFHLHRREYTRRPSPDDRDAVLQTLDGVDFQWLWAAAYAGNDWRRLRNWWTFAGAVVKAGRAGDRPDVVIGSSPQLLAARAAKQVAKTWGCPFVFEVRDLWPESLVAAGGSKGVAYRLLDAIADDLYRSADLIVVLAPGAGDYLKNKGVTTPIVCVPNGTDVQGSAAAVPARVGDELTLVYAGAHGPANGLQSVLDAAALLGAESGVRFVLVGDGPDRPRLQEDAGTRGLTQVSFVGPVPKPELTKIFAEADAGLMILREAPLFSFAVSPNKLFDYFAAGLPVINNVAGDVADMVAQSGAGVQASDSSGEALAAAVAAFQRLQADARHQMRRDGRAWVERTHSREVLGEQLYSALAGLR